MYIETEDFRNVWVLAHQWAGQNSNKLNPHDLHEQVKVNMMRIASAILRKQLKAQNKYVPILDNDSIFEIIFFFKHFYRMYKCRSGKYFDKAYFETIYIRRYHFIAWCEKEKYPDPEFWQINTDIYSNKSTNRPKNEAEDKAVCRAIAKVYWDIDPNIHPAHMAESKSIAKYGNGNLYEIDTIKDWISDLDPLIKERKTGRPPKIDYVIDLKSGALTIPESNLDRKK
jgi:hypothetical protein